MSQELKTAQDKLNLAMLQESIELVQLRTLKAKLERLALEAEHKEKEEKAAAANLDSARAVETSDLMHARVVANSKRTCALEEHLEQENLTAAVRLKLERLEIEAKIAERIEQQDSKAKTRNAQYAALAEDVAKYKVMHDVIKQKLAEKIADYKVLEQQLGEAKRQYNTLNQKHSRLGQLLADAKKSDTANSVNMAALQKRNEQATAKLTVTNNILANMQVELERLTSLEASHLMEIARLNEDAASERALAKQKLDSALCKVDDEVKWQLIEENPTGAVRDLLNELHALNLALSAERDAHEKTKINLEELVAAAAADRLCATHGLSAAAAEIAALKKTNAEMLAKIDILESDLATAMQLRFAAASPY
jgi:hypothetical protein